MHSTRPISSEEKTKRNNLMIELFRQNPNMNRTAMRKLLLDKYGWSKEAMFATCRAAAIAGWNELPADKSWTWIQKKLKVGKYYEVNKPKEESKKKQGTEKEEMKVDTKSIDTRHIANEHVAKVMIDKNVTDGKVSLRDGKVLFIFDRLVQEIIEL